MDHHLDDDTSARPERELTLSTGAILGIFVALVVLCGGFFGFGYTMGRKSAPTPLSLSEVTPEQPDALPASSVPKPSPGEAAPTTPSEAPVAEKVSKPPRHPAAVAPEDSGTDEVAAPKPAPAIAAKSTPTPAPAPIVRQPAPVSPAALSPSAAGAPGTFMVQVAAVSHKDDADLLLGALRARGYAVSARSATGDSFIHVQVGPFRDKKEADAMRARLLADGYNAIVKP